MLRPPYLLIETVATMICQRCTHRLHLRSISRSLALRSLSTTSARPNPSTPPSATSSAAQPFSTPFTPSPSKTPTIPPKTSSKSHATAVKSSVPAGTPLKGLGYMKGQEPPMAKEDDEYPTWLWGLLENNPKGADAEGEAGDAFGECQLLTISRLEGRTWCAEVYLRDLCCGLCYLVAWLAEHSTPLAPPTADNSIPQPSQRSNEDSHLKLHEPWAVATTLHNTLSKSRSSNSRSTCRLVWAWKRA